MIKYECFNENTTIQFNEESEANEYVANNNGFELRTVEVVITPNISTKTAKDYKKFADDFLLQFSQECIDNKNSIATNDLLEVHFAEMNKALQVARLDKFFHLLQTTPILLPFYTQEVKDRYLAQLYSFLSS